MNTQPYDPMGQAMQALQVLGNRKAQQQGFQIDQQRLALEAQRLAQQGDQFDRGLGMEQQSLAQRGSQFDQRQAFEQAVQQYVQGRQAQMDPLEMARMEAQTRGMQIGNEQAPEELRLKQLQAALAAGGLVNQQAQQAFLQQHYGKQDQNVEDEMILNYAQSMLPVVSPNGTVVPNPIAQQLIDAVMQKRLKGLPQPPQAGPTPIGFGTVEEQNNYKK